jgi:uncharacterized protein YcfJ
VHAALQVNTPHIFIQGGFMRRSILSTSATLALGAIAFGLAAPASAQEVGRVISSTALISQVSTPRQVCAQEVVQVQNQTPATKTGAGAVIGAVAGGAVGNSVGQGSGRALATILGVIGGAFVGDRVEGGSPVQVTTSQQTINRCSTQNFIENRTTGYQVVYEYAGKQYSVQMPQDPGPTIQLQVAPVGQVLPAPAAQTAPRVVSQVESGAVSADAAPVQSDSVVLVSQSPYQPVYQTQPDPFFAVAPVVVTAPGYYYPQYYPRPAFGASLVIRSGHYGHGGYRGQYGAYPRYFR